MEHSIQSTESLPPTSANEGPVRERELDVLRQLSGDATAFRDRIDDYVMLSQQLVAAIEDALQQNDALALQGDARSLMGVSAQIGAHRVSADCEVIEIAAGKGDLRGAQARYRTLVDDHKAALEKLQSIRGSAFP